MTHYTLLSCIESKRLSPTQTYGRFALGNFIQGQGLTIANALRRALLSELIGTAICFAEIKGAKHDYESLVGIRESVLDILLNLRQIILKSENELFNTEFAYLHVKGPGVVRARDLKLPCFINVVHPNQLIATLNHKGELYIKMLINCGKTYLTQTPSSFDYENQINKLKKRSWLGVGYTPPNSSNYANFWKKEKRRLKNLTKEKPLTNFTKININRSKINLKTKLQLNKTVKAAPNLLTPPSITNKNSVNQKIQMLESRPIDYRNYEFNNLHNDVSVDGKLVKPKPLGYFPLNAIFAPVLKVNYTIEAITKTKEKVLIEIWTNGSLDPRQAIHRTVRALIQLLLPFQTTQLNPLPQLTKNLQKDNQKTLNTSKPLLTPYKQKLFNRQTKLSFFKKNLMNLKSFHRIHQPFNQKLVENIADKKNSIFLSQERLDDQIKYFNKFSSISMPIELETQFELETQLELELWLKKALDLKNRGVLKLLKALFKPQKKLKPFKIGVVNQLQQIQLLSNRNTINVLLNHPDPKNAFQWQDSSFLLAKMIDKNPLNKPFQKQKKIFRQNDDDFYDGFEIVKKAALKTTEQNKMEKHLKNQRKVLKKKFKQSFSLLRKRLFYVELTQLQLPKRVYLILKMNHIHTIEHLVSSSKKQLTKIHSLSLDDIKRIQIRLRDYVLTQLQL